MAARNSVLWYGPLPPGFLSEFNHRNLDLVELDPNAAPPCAGATTAVFYFTATNIASLTDAANKHVALFLNYGMSVELVAEDDSVLGKTQAMLQRLLPLIRRYPRTAPEPHELAERAARHIPGPSIRESLGIQIAGNRLPLSAADRILLQRAFSYCKDIVLSELTGGRSDARVFSVHATIDTSVAGIWPQPFFVKLDSRDKIETEATNYATYADHFIPFGLRPNIRHKLYGASRGLLVGDFADRSESLWDMARRNMAAQAVSALIDETLGGWRFQAYAEDPKKGSIAIALRNAGIVDPAKIRPRYIEYVKEHVRDVPDGDIWEKLVALDQSYREAPMHGDLHGENVRVRAGQAILIDLASVARGPLTTDLAALETWFAFELPPEDDRDSFANAQWQRTIDVLYSPASFRHPPAPADPTDCYCWMTSVVRQIRQMGIAAQFCPTEYQSAVVAYLLRRAQWDDGCLADLFRRSYGYVVAARLADDLGKWGTT